MPFKHNAARRHRIPRARYRVTNWPAYEADLRRHCSPTLWLDGAALAGWAAPRRSSPGRQPLYSDLAIETAMSRYEHLIGPKLRAYSSPAQQGEVAIAIAVLNTMTQAARPVSVRAA